MKIKNVLGSEYMSEIKIPIYRRIRFKICIFYIFFIVIPTIFFTILFVEKVIDTNAEEHTVSIRNGLQQAKLSVEKNIDMIAKSGESFALDPMIQTTIKKANNKNAFKNKQLLTQKIMTLKKQYNGVKSIKLIHGNSCIRDTANLIYYDKDLTSTDKWKKKFYNANIDKEATSIHKIAYGEYISMFSNESVYLPRDVDYHQATYEKTDLVDTFYFPIMDNKHDKYLAILEINMKKNELLGLFNDYFENQDYMNIIYDSFTNEIIQFEDAKFAAKFAPKFAEEFSQSVNFSEIKSGEIISYKRKNYQVFITEITTVGLSVASFVSVPTVLSPVDMRYIIVTVLFGVLILAIGIAMVYYNKMIKNLLLLGQKMRGISMETLVKEVRTPIKIEGNDEIAQLGDGYNIMIQKINSLMEDIKEAYERENNAIYKGIDEKLKAHFLFNALDMVRLTAQRNNQEEITKAVNTIMNYLTYTLKNSDAYVSVADEIRDVSCFIDMHNLVRVSEIKYVIKTAGNLTGNLSSCKILKFIIQPLVENSIKHGFKNKLNMCELYIEIGSDNSYIYITIEDNGCGFDMDNPPDAKGFGIGISHVEEKLKRTFFDDYEFRMRSYTDIGTCIQIKMPIYLQEKNTNHKLVDNNGVK